MRAGSTKSIIRAEPLTTVRFAPFGTVADAGGANSGRSVNQGRARRVPGIDGLSHESAAATPVLDFYRIAPSTLPFAVTCLERHPLSSQVFVPMTPASFMVVVAAEDRGRPDLSRVMAFIGDGTQVVHYRPGTWHAPMVALGAPCLMTMLMWQTGDTRDCEEFSDFAGLELSVVQ